jgi:hypothetical protein
VYFGMYVIGFTFYDGNVPEYYLIGLFPLVAILFAVCLDALIRRYRIALPFVILWFSFVFLASVRNVAQIDPQGLGKKQEIVSAIKERTGDAPVHIVKDMVLSDSFGYDYLFDYAGVAVDGNQQNANTYWISYPIRRAPFIPDDIKGAIALTYPKKVSKIYTTKDAKVYGERATVRVPNSWRIVPCGIKDITQYLLSPDAPKTCDNSTTIPTGIVVTIDLGCHISLIPDSTEVSIKTRLPVKKTENNSFITSVDEYSCIRFEEVANQSGQPSPEMIDILTSLK